jgi:hypothetical protein
MGARPWTEVVCLMKRTVLVGLVIALFGAWVQPALGSYSNLWGDGYDEGFNGGSGWRGVWGDIYAYDWTLVQSPPASDLGVVVNSLYVAHVNHNPYDARWIPPVNFNDGYRDGTDHNQVHLEVGICKGHMGPNERWVFWQWNNIAGINDPRMDHEYLVTSIGWLSNGFKIGNVSMGSSGDEEWHINYGSDTMDDPRIDMRVGRAMVSAERLWRTSFGGDSAYAHFKNLQRKNSNATWLNWQDANPIYNGDEFAHFTKNSNTDLSHSPD